MLVRVIETRTKVCKVYEHNGSYEITVNGYLRDSAGTLTEAMHKADRIARRG